jgi:hypothetical protein
MTNLMHSFLMYLFMPLNVSSRKCSSSGGPNCINTSSGITHSGEWLSDVPVKRKPVFSWPARQTVTLPVCVIPDYVLIQSGPPDDEHLLLETCRGINKYIKKDCIKLVITKNCIKMRGQQNTKKHLFPANRMFIVQKTKLYGRKDGNVLKKNLSAGKRLAIKFKLQNPVENSSSSAMRRHQQNQIQQPFFKVIHSRCVYSHKY